MPDSASQEPVDPPLLRTLRLLLRMPEVGDAAAVADYNRRNRQFHAPWMPLRTEFVFTEEYWKARIPVIRADHLERGTGLVFYLWKEYCPETIVGKIAYSQIVRGPAEFCFLGYDLDQDVQGCGWMTEALRAANEYVFVELRLHRIMANYMPRNERSGRLLRRLGFVAEGYARDYLHINGQWEDHVLTSLTNQQWRKGS